MGDLYCNRPVSPVVTIIPDNPQIVIGSSPSLETFKRHSERQYIKARGSTFLPVPLRFRQSKVIPANDDVITSSPKSGPRQGITQKQTKKEIKRSKKNAKRAGLLYPTPILYQDLGTIPQTFSSPSPKGNAAAVLPNGYETAESTSGFSISPTMMIMIAAAVLFFILMRR